MTALPSPQRADGRHESAGGRTNRPADVSQRSLHTRPPSEAPLHRLLPQSPEAEKGVLCAVLNFPGEVLALCRREGLTAACFHHPANAAIYDAAEQAEGQGHPLDFITLTQLLRDQGQLQEAGGAPYITEVFTYLPTAANVKEHIEIVREKQRQRQLVALGNEILTRSYQDPSPVILAELASRADAISASTGSWEDALDALRFDPATTPPDHAPIYTLGDAVIATPGNIVGVCAQAKAGKTAFLGAVIASTMHAEGDTLGVRSENPQGGAVIVFDTEQSERHFHDCLTRAILRARKPLPGWLRAYRLKPNPVADRRRFLPAELRRAAKACGSIHSVILDGIGDMVNDPNDPAESFALIQELHELADEYSTAILCVLHENPGGAEFGKTRGHLGSQLERKAESNLRLQKDTDGVTVVFSERSRGAHIPKDRGTRFQWSDEARMHVSVETCAAAKADAKAQNLSALAAEILKGAGDIGLTWSEVHERIRELEDMRQGGARRRFTELLKARMIFKMANGKYRLP